MTLPGVARAAGRQIVDVGLPQGVLIVLLSRDDCAIVPQGGTVLEPGDRLLILVDSDTAADVREILGLNDGASAAGRCGGRGVSPRALCGRGGRAAS